jgi:hypothetical protein
MRQAAVLGLAQHLQLLLEKLLLLLLMVKLQQQVRGPAQHTLLLVKLLQVPLRLLGP